ncbi:G8 domain-containing protein [bacterium]|nr:G8 domain-containing protein [bacterium]
MIRSRVLIASVVVPLLILVAVFLTRSKSDQDLEDLWLGENQVTVTSISGKPESPSGNLDSKNQSLGNIAEAVAGSGMESQEVFPLRDSIVDLDPSLLVPMDKVTHRAIKSGNWADPSVWGGTLPYDGARVVVPEGLEILIGAEGTAHLKALNIEGEVRLSGNVDSNLHVDTLVVNATGALRAGGVNNPVSVDSEVMVTLEAFEDPNATPEERRNSAVIVAEGALDLHGQPKTGVALLGALPTVGQKELVLVEAPAGWQKGDLIVLGGNRETREERPAFMIESVNGNRVILNSVDPDVENWEGLKTSFEIDQNQIGFAINTSRNVAVSSPPVEDSDFPNGSVLVKNGGTATLSGVGLYGLGVDDVLLRGQDDAVNRSAVKFEAGAGTSTISGASLVNAPESGISVGGANVQVVDSVAHDNDGAAWVTESGSPSRLIWPKNRITPSINGLSGGR